MIKAPPEDAEGKIVLVVENVPEWQDHIGNLVRDTLPGVELHFARDANEALAIIERINLQRTKTGRRVNVVLSDLHMSTNADGAANGDALLEKLMQLNFSKNLTCMAEMVSTQVQKFMNLKTPLHC